MKKKIEKPKHIIESEKKLAEIKSRKKKNLKKNIIIGLIISSIISLIVYFITSNLKNSIIIFFVSLAIVGTYFIIKEVLKKSERIRKMETIFPDFIELMASNLRAGMTIDKALLLSSRKEFSPLDEEILILGKEIVTGKEIKLSLLELAKRIKSEKILKTITIINSGIKSGGNLAILLEQTAMNMRTRGFTEKKAASNVLMYVIFIFFAVSMGAPTLFSLSSILVQVLTGILADIPTIDTASLNSPFSLTSISVSTTFITWFALVFLLIINFLASLLLGIVNKGEGKAGLKYMLPLIVLGTTIFFIVRSVLLSYFSGLI